MPGSGSRWKSRTTPAISAARTLLRSARSPSSAFFGEGSPAKIDYQKSWYPSLNLSAGGPRSASLYWSLWSPVVWRCSGAASLFLPTRTRGLTKFKFPVPTNPNQDAVVFGLGHEALLADTGLPL